MSASRREKGAVFVFTLAILAGLTAIVAGVAISQRIVIKTETNDLERQKAKMVAQAGIQRAIATLCDESSSGLSTSGTGLQAAGTGVNSKGCTTLQDDWASLGTTGSDRFVMNVGSFRLQVIDAASRINLNSATQAQLTNLPITTQQVDSILDWRSAGETARADGAKDSYYNGLTNPYDAALVPFSTVSELLDVRNFGPVDLYDPSTNQSGSSVTLPNFPDGRTPTLAELLTTDSQSGIVNQNGTNLQNLNTISLNSFNRPPLSAIPAGQRNATRNSFITATKQTTWAGFIGAARRINGVNLSSTLLTYLLNTYYVGSATPTGKINPNTAPAAVLQTIPNLTPDEAQSIISQQTTGITTMGGLLNLPGMTTVATAAPFLDYFAIQSRTFIVRVIGTVGSTNYPLEAVVKITPATASQTSATAQILRMEEQPFQDMTGRWGWPSTTTNDVTLEAGS